MPRVPLVLQLTEVECGAACLAMILGYFGRPTRVSECREACGGSRDGATAQAIANTAAEYGLRMRGYSIETSKFRHVPLPAIAHWEFNHFVVVEGWKKARVNVVDPAVGRRSLTHAEFDKGFTGVVLTAERPTAMAVAGKPGGFGWRDSLKQVLTSKGMPGVLAQIIVASLLLQLFALASPIMMRFLFDRVLPFGLRERCRYWQAVRGRYCCGPNRDNLPARCADGVAASANRFTFDAWIPQACSQLASLVFSAPVCTETC